MHGLTLDPRGHLQATITLTFGKASRSNILPRPVCFTKPSSPHSDSSWDQELSFFFFFLVIHLKEEISQKAVLVRH